MSHVLQTRNLSKKFGGFVATDNVSLNIEFGARHALIGPNGAGKTTLVNLLAGFLVPTSGDVLLEDEVITTRPQHQRVKDGLVRTFQINRLFLELTVFESVVMAVNEHLGIGHKMWRPTDAYLESLRAATDLLKSLHLIDVAHRQTRDLAYGKQRLLEIALALAAKPKVLLLDEPAAGVPAEESAELIQTIKELPQDVTVLLIEHDMRLVFDFADRITVLVNGAILTEDTPEVIAKDRRVKEVYLGEAISV